MIPVAVITWAGAGFAVTHADLAWTACAGSAALSLTLLAVLARWRRALPAVTSLIAVGLAFAAVAAASSAFAQPTRAAVAALPLGGGRALSIDALVVGKIEPAARGWRFDAITEQISIGEQRHPAAVPILVRVAQVSPGLDLGARVRLTGTAVPAQEGDRAVLIADANAPPEVTAPPQGVFAVAAALRKGLQASVRDLPAPGAGLIAGIAVGDTSAVTAELDIAMKASSLSHLTAVSGANCALVVGIAFGLAALMGARRGVRIAVGVAALTGFVVLVSPEPSVVRAATMALVAMSGLLLGRIGAGLSVLCVAVVTLLAIDPWLASSLGFALSSAATGALLLLAGPLAEGMTRWMPGPLALALSVPLAAQLACGPLLILIAPSVPLYGVLANLVAGPTAAAGTVLGLLACLSAGLPALAHGLAALAWVPAAWIAETAMVASALPGNTIPWLAGLPGLLALTAVGAASTLLLAARPAPRWSRRLAVLLIAATAGVLLAVGPVAKVVEHLRTPTEWTIVACDVGQGDAVLIRSADRVALVDTGPDPARLSDCLDRFRVSRIDLLVLTHFDLDHRGGVAAVVGRVDLVLHGPADDVAASAVLAELARSGGRLQEAQEGMAGRLGDADWRVLWPRRNLAGYRGNDASVVVEMQGGEVPRIILLGDLSATPQAALAASLPGAYDIVKVAHHGSADQHEALYTRIGARVALVTVGQNTYGHPRDETLELLLSAGARSLRTDRSGAIALWRENDRVRIWQERGSTVDR